MITALQNSLENKKLAAQVLKNYAQDSLSYFHLQDAREYFFSPSGKSFLSFKILNKVAVVASDPVGEQSELPTLLKSFMQYSATWKLIPCFIGLSNVYKPILKDNGLKITKIGEEAILTLDLFEKNKLKKKVKRAVRHIEELGIDVFFFSPQNIPTSIREQIEEISRNWIQTKGGREKGFSMTLKRIPNEFDQDCSIAVAIKNQTVLGYICFAPVYQAATVSLDQARRKLDAPNGLNEFLIVKSAEYFKEHHIKKISLNFTTFANMAEPNSWGFPIKTVLGKVLGKMYRCDSLRAFNEKFYPKWESRYVAYPSFRHAPLYLLAIFRAER